MINFFVGLSLGSASTVESGVVVLDKFNNLILVDKLFSMNDVQHFFDNYSSLKDSLITVSIPWDNSMLEGKWRILSKPYQMVNSNEHIINRDNWTQRYSSRGCEYFLKLKEQGVRINRFELYLARQKLNLYSNFKERSPADCKFLQNILKVEYGFENIPNNMMPAGQLEAIIGALVSRETLNGNTNVLYEYKGLDVIGLK
ncbi:hypothetical protein IJI31_06840 [bacterium]|nr:hypothetical protein [bacterium]